ncbi:MAG: alpha/beta fold hydrolase [Methylorubrum populi]
MPAVRVFCLPYSGASAAIYARWRRLLPAAIETCPVELPGRGRRMDEPFCCDPHALAAALAAEIAPLVSGAEAPPYALFGHSLGAILAFELAHALAAHGAGVPLALFASGTEAPAVRDDSDFRRPRSDAELIAALRAYAGTPDEALADPELMALTLPVLRADFLTCGAYVYRRRPPLPCPIVALGGLHDDVSRHDLEAWGRETCAGFDLAMFAGGHFFIHGQQAQVLATIAERIATLIRSEPAPGPTARPTAGPPRTTHRHGTDARRTTTPGRDGMTDLAIRPLRESGPLPLLVSPAREGAGLDIAAALPAIRDAAQAHLHEAGGLLLRGFALQGTDAFRAFAAGFGHELLDYEFGSTPRSPVTQGVYTSTEYPPHQHIPLHNEQAYTRDWPMKIWFYCQQAASEGGETPIADSRAIYRAVPQSIRDRFAADGLMYVRNYGNGLDVAWSQVFGTEDRRSVEAYCESHGITCEWKPDGELRTRQVCQGVAAHPVTGEPVWFNQAHLFHVSNLEPEVRSTLLDIVEEEDLPRNVFYGDGSPIPDEDLAAIRAVLAAHTIVFPWQTGDVVMLDNMLTAHARTPFKGPRKVVVAMAEANRRH